MIDSLPFASPSVSSDMIMVTVQFDLSSLRVRFEFASSSIWVRSEFDGKTNEMATEEPKCNCTEANANTGRMYAPRLLMSKWANGVMSSRRLAKRQQQQQHHRATHTFFCYSLIWSFAYLVIRLFRCSVAQLFGYLVIRLASQWVVANGLTITVQLTVILTTIDWPLWLLNGRQLVSRPIHNVAH